MFSTDKNIETLAQLIEQLKDYIGLRAEYTKLDFADRFVRLLTVLILLLLLFVLLLHTFLYLSLSAVCVMAPALGLVQSFLAVAAAHVLIFLMVVVFRKSLLERPLVKLLSRILFSE